MLELMCTPPLSDEPVYRSLSMPAFSSTEGCTMPEPRISTQRVPRPSLRSISTSICADGSVNGKYDGPKRTRREPP